MEQFSQQFLKAAATQPEHVVRKAEFDNKLGELSGLQTQNKTNIVSAINELFLDADSGKNAIAAAIGSPANAAMSFAELASNILLVRQAPIETRVIENHPITYGAISASFIPVTINTVLEPLFFVGRFTTNAASVAYSVAGTTTPSSYSCAIEYTFMYIKTSEKIFNQSTTNTHNSLLLTSATTSGSTSINYPVYMTPSQAPMWAAFTANISNKIATANIPVYKHVLTNGLSASHNSINTSKGFRFVVIGNP